jgi:hypothetical protein
VGADGAAPDAWPGPAGADRAARRRDAGAEDVDVEGDLLAMMVLVP